MRKTHLPMARIDLFVLQPGLAYPPPVILQQLPDGPVKRSLGKIVDTYARYFQREFRYDFPPFSCEEDDCWDASKWRTVVLCGKKGSEFETAIIGATGFRLETNRPQYNGWWMHWAWLHPHYRGQSHFDAAFQQIAPRLAPIFVQPPISIAMAAYVVHHPQHIAQESIGYAESVLRQHGLAPARQGAN